MKRMGTDSLAGLPRAIQLGDGKRLVAEPGPVTTLPILDQPSNAYGGHAGLERSTGHSFCLSGAFGKAGGLGWEWASLVRVVQVGNSPAIGFRWRWSSH